MEKVKNLIFATDNKNKVYEINRLISDNLFFRVITKSEAGIPEPIEETGSTILENALLKANYITEKYRLDCFSEDTGLVVDSLGGEPGVHSARYAGTENNSERNIELLLQRLENKEDRSAKFVTIIVLNIQDKQFIFEGEVKGIILYQKRGDNGFGYDPVFQPDGFDKSFAEMDTDTKSKISHRGIATAKLINFLNSYNLD